MPIFSKVNATILRISYSPHHISPIMSKRPSIFEKGESYKPPERPKTPGAYESSTLTSHDDAFVGDDSKDELGERTPTPIRNLPIHEPPLFTFPKDLLRAREIYDRFKPRDGYEKHIDTFFQYKIAEYENDGLTDADLQELVYDDFVHLNREHLNYVQKRILLRFRKLLRRYGVYVNIKMEVESAIIEVLSRTEHHEWTYHQLREYQRDESQPFISAKWANVPVGIGSKTFDQTRSGERSSDHPNDRQASTAPVAPAAPAASAATTAPTVPETSTAPEVPEALTATATRELPEPRYRRDGLHRQTGPPPSDGGDSSDPDDSDHPNNGNGHGRGNKAPRRERPGNRNNDRSDARYQVQQDSRLLIDLSKIYRDNDMYKGYDDSWDLKVSIFDEHCQRVSLPDRLRYKAFPTMLSGAALEHYQANITSLPDSYEGLCRMMTLNFEGLEHQRNMLVKWTNISFKSYIQKDPTEDLQVVFNNMVMDIRLLQHTIPVTMRNPDVYHMRIMTACDGVPECYSAICNPRSTATELINQIKQTIDSYQKTFPRRTIPTEAFLTDRRFYNNPSNPTRKPYDKYSRYDRKPRQTFTAPPSRSKDDCYFPGCKVKGCRYYKHTQEEKDRVKGEYRNKYNNLDDKSFKTRYDHFITDTGKGSDNDDSDDDDVGDQLIDQYFVDQDDDVEEISRTFFTSMGSYDAQKAAIALNNAASVHMMTAETCVAEQERYNSEEFMGIMIDTGASRRSTVGYNQYLAWKAIEGTEYNPATAGQANVMYGIGNSISIGSFWMKLPFGDVEWNVMRADIPFLFCLADMDKFKFKYDNVDDVAITPYMTLPVYRRFGHAFLTWKVKLQNIIQYSIDDGECLLTEVELRRIHRRFGHPSARKFYKVLKRSGHDEDFEAIKQLTKFCHHCQLHGKSPGRFKFSLPDKDYNFNHSVLVDVLYIDRDPVLHVVDDSTCFQAARWLDNISAKHTWDKLRECWIDTYIGPPEYIVHDAGTNFMAKEFKQHATSMSIQTKTVPVEAHHSIGKVERFHAPLRRSLKIIQEETQDIGVSKAAMLQMAVKAINDTAGPNGLVPTLLVFGTFPRIVDSDPPTPNIQQRASAISKAMKEIHKLHSAMKVRNALNARNGPSTTALHELPLNSKVLVWREGSGTAAGEWRGPFSLVSMEKETCIIELPRGPTRFRSTSVKPYYDATEEENITLPEFGTVMSPEDPEALQGPLPNALQDDEVLDSITVIPPEGYTSNKPPRSSARNASDVDQFECTSRDISSSTPQIRVFMQEHTAQYMTDLPDPVKYKDSRKKEIEGLTEKGVFEVVPILDVPPGTRIFRSRFVDEVKNEGTSTEFSKSRLVIQAYNDAEKTTVLTQSPTIQRSCQRILASLAASTRKASDTGVYIRDITQAYTQSTSNLHRTFYAHAPEEMNLPTGMILLVIKPLYGVPEAGNHWFKTYHTHHCEKLKMQQSTYDPCLLYTNSEDTGFGIVGLQTDDTLIVGDEKFIQAEEKELKDANFMAKDREELTHDHPLKFNGVTLALQEDDIYLNQEKQCMNLQSVSAESTDIHGTRGKVRKNASTHDQYVAQRARGAYVATMCQPEASFDLSIAAQTTKPDKDDITALNKRIKWQKENSSRGLNYVPLDLDSLKIVVFADASFANNKDYSSQIGYVIVMMDKHNNANTIHWSSIKCKRITRSVLASELYGLVQGFDIGAAITATVGAILNQETPLTICTDSKSLYDLLTKLGTTSEKRLMIDIMALRQSYERREIVEVIWIDGPTNPADAMTKGKPCQALTDLIDTNKISIKPMKWVERE